MDLAPLPLHSLSLETSSMGSRKSLQAPTASSLIPLSHSNIDGGETLENVGKSKSGGDSWELFGIRRSRPTSDGNVPAMIVSGC